MSQAGTRQPSRGARPARGSRYSRKSFLGRLGLGAATVGAGGLLRTETAGAKLEAQKVSKAGVEGHFGRIFHGLPPFASESSQVQAALRDIGKPGGILDAKDPLDKGPVLLITDPSLSAKLIDTKISTPLVNLPLGAS